MGQNGGGDEGETVGRVAAPGKHGFVGVDLRVASMATANSGELPSMLLGKRQRGKGAGECGGQGEGNGGVGGEREGQQHDEFVGDGNLRFRRLGGEPGQQRNRGCDSALLVVL